jgi:hypothetical protein
VTHTAVVTFTARNIQWILNDGGSQAWRLDVDRARRSEFLVCTQNCHNKDGFGHPMAQHRAAFLIGRISDVVASQERPDRWLIEISEYTECNIPNTWGKFGHMRYPVWYTTLEELGIDADNLPPFRPMGPRRYPGRFSEAAAAPVLAPRQLQPNADEHGRDRFDAILAQIDRIPDLPAPFDPLDWDEHGLPQ